MNPVAQGPVGASLSSRDAVLKVFAEREEQTGYEDLWATRDEIYEEVKALMAPSHPVPTSLASLLSKLTETGVLQARWEPGSTGRRQYRTIDSGDTPPHDAPMVTATKPAPSPTVAKPAPAAKAAAIVTPTVPPAPPRAPAQPRPLPAVRPSDSLRERRPLPPRFRAKPKRRRHPMFAEAQTIKTVQDWVEWKDAPKNADGTVHYWARVDRLPIKCYPAAGGVLIICHKDAAIPDA